MKPTTRLRILEYIRKYQTASVKELSAQMGKSGANIRHHLAMLESNDLIEIVGVRIEGRGRPRQVYGISRRVLGDGLDKLSGMLLDLWQSNLPDEKRETGLRFLAQRLAGETDLSLPIMKRLVRTVAGLNELRYQAHWEASAVGPRLILGHCPYAAIIADHPELCRMDAFLLEARLGSSVEQTAKLQMSEKGLPFCAFLKLEN
jgi:predicted ArsR family transcriptional regulator